MQPGSGVSVDFFNLMYSLVSLPFRELLSGPDQAPQDARRVKHLGVVTMRFLVEVN